MAFMTARSVTNIGRRKHRHRRAGVVGDNNARPMPVSDESSSLHSRCQSVYEGL